MSNESAKAAITGGCQCGSIRYECNMKLDLEAGSHKIFRCNCTYCQKLGTTNLHVEPEAFKLLKPASKEELGDYLSTKKTVHRYFCTTCGVHVWMQGAYELQGQTVKLFVVNLATVDQPQEGLELNQAKIQYWDGLNNNFAAGPRDVPWPGGLP